MLRTTALAVLCLIAAVPSFATAYTWNGSASDLWSNPANWTPNGVPQSGDSLTFGASVPTPLLLSKAADRPVTVNDLAPGLRFSLSSYSAYEIHGNEIVATSIWNNTSGSPFYDGGKSLTIYAPLRLAGNADYDLAGVPGPIDIGPYRLNLAVSGIVSGPIAGTGQLVLGGANCIITGRCVATLRGTHTFTGVVSAKTTSTGNNVFSLGSDGSTLPASTITLQGLTGSGTFGPVTVSGYLGGALNTGSLKVGPGARFEASLSIAQGPVRVSGTVDIAQAVLEMFDYVAAAQGQVFTLIDNDGTDPVIGTFKDLPEGAIFERRAVRYVVSYVGGDGNDVTLTALNASPTDGDHDGDGRADLIWYHEGSGRLHRMSIDTDEITSQETVYVEPNLDWRPVARGDFDGDGLADLLWRNDATGEIYQMRFGPGGQPAGGRVIYRESNPAWQVVGVLRLRSKERQADILWWNRDTGALYLLGMDGFDVVEQGFIAGAPGPEWRYEVAGRFVCDVWGTDSLVWRNQATGEARMAFPIRGTTFFQLKYDKVFHTEPDPAWHIVGGMHTNFGILDALMWWNDQTGELYKMSEPCAQDKGQVYHRPPSPEWRPVAFDDYDGDGAGDVAWRNMSDGRIYIMLTSQGGEGPGNTIHQEADPAWKAGLQFLGPPLP